jgi:hypothetical protein
MAIPLDSSPPDNEVELVERYLAELDQVAANAYTSLERAKRRPTVALATTLATEIASCAMRNRDAALLTLFEPPAGAGEHADLGLSRPPIAVADAMSETLAAGQEHGWIRPGVDLRRASERFCTSMLNLAAGVPDGKGGSGRLLATKVRVLLYGVALHAPDDAGLDGSRARAVADEVVHGWEREGGDEERAARLLVAARTELAGPAVEAMTSAETAPHLTTSEHELLRTEMRALTERIATGWSAVLDSDASAIQTLDAVMWVNIHVIEHFRQEFRVQLALYRASPANLAEFGWSFSTRLDQIKAVLARGTRAGEIGLYGGSARDRAWSVLELAWMPEPIVDAGARRALTLGRDTVLRGVAVRR